MKKTLLVFCLTVILSFSFTSCGDVMTASTSDKAKNSDYSDITLDIVTTKYSDYTKDWWDKLEYEFENDNPGIDLNIDVVDWEDLYKTISSRISVGNTPDILNMDTYADFVEEGLLMPVHDYASDAFLSDFIPSFLEANTYNETLWALPSLGSCRVMYCNMDILKSCGIQKAPSTWYELKTTCQAIKEKRPDIIPWGLDLTKEEGEAAFAYYTWNNGGGFKDSLGEWSLDSPANIEAVNYLKSLVDAGFCNPNPLGENHQMLSEDFLSGRIAMVIAPQSLYDMVDGFEIEISSIPENTGADPVNLGVCDRMMAFYDDGNDDYDVRMNAISKFYEYFYDTSRYSEYVVYEGYLPVTSDSVSYLSNNAIDYQRGDGRKMDNEDFYKDFSEILKLCRFYPVSSKEWTDVKRGVTYALEDIIKGEDALSALNKLQQEIVLTLD